MICQRSGRDTYFTVLLYSSIQCKLQKNIYYKEHLYWIFRVTVISNKPSVLNDLETYTLLSSLKNIHSDIQYLKTSKAFTWWSTSNMAAKSKSWLSWSISCRWKKTTVLKVCLDRILGISMDVTIHCTTDTLDSRVSVKSFTVSFSSDAMIQTWFVLSEWIRNKVFHNIGTVINYLYEESCLMTTYGCSRCINTTKLCYLSNCCDTLVATYSLFPVFLPMVYQLDMLCSIYEIKGW